MVYQFFIAFFFLLLSFTKVEAVELTSVALQYQPNVVVEQVSIIRLEIQQRLPGLNLNLKTEQKLEGEMQVVSDQADMPVANAPFDLEFLPKRLVIQIDANDRLTVYDSAGRTSHPYMAQLEYLMNNAMKVHLREDFTLDDSIEQLDAVGRDLPQIKSFIPAAMLTQTFDQIFALGGKNLATGHTHRKKILFGDTHLFPLNVDYEVTAANFKEVQAELRGKLDTYRVKIGVVQKTQQGSDKKEPVDVILTLSGQVKGHISWDRRQALLCNMSIEHSFQGVMKAGNEEVPIAFTLVQILESKRKSL